MADQITIRRAVVQQALEALLNSRPLATEDDCIVKVREHDMAITALRAALAEPQEPVAWRTFDGEGGYDYRAYDDNENYAEEWAALTGLRRSEILRLTPDDIRDGTIIVSNQAKSGRGRIVPMPPEAARIAARRVPFGIGAPLLTKRFNAARAAAGMPEVRFHDLRHAFGTWLAEARTDAPTIRDLMGHSSLTVTSRYLQTASDAGRRAVAQLPSLGVRVGSGGKRAARKKAA